MSVDINSLIIDHKISHVFRYGSVVYGTNHENSDEDFICVSITQKDDLIEYDDIKIYSLKFFNKEIENCEISCLECLFLPSDMILKSRFKLLTDFDQGKLRESISKKAANSWVKGRKKLVLPDSYNLNVALKSIFHSFRIYDFGIQIALNNKIIDYNSSNNILFELKELSLQYEKDILWDKIKEKYQPLKNKIHSSFKLATI